MLEHPVDLGAARDRIPASIWALDITRELIQNCGAETVAAHQRTFRALTSKPARSAGTLGDLARLGMAAASSQILPLLGTPPSEVQLLARASAAA